MMNENILSSAWKDKQQAFIHCRTNFSLIQEGWKTIFFFQYFCLCLNTKEVTQHYIWMEVRLKTIMSLDYFSVDKSWKVSRNATTEKRRYYHWERNKMFLLMCFFSLCTLIIKFSRVLRGHWHPQNTTSTTNHIAIRLTQKHFGINYVIVKKTKQNKISKFNWIHKRETIKKKNVTSVTDECVPLVGVVSPRAASPGREPEGSHTPT